MSAKTRVPPTAIVHPTARLGVGVDIGPYAVIGPDVQLGDRVWVCLLYTSPSPRD